MSLYKYIKRIIDILISIISLALLLPLFLITILILSLTGEKEIFYTQTRIGYKNKQFKIFKFATMLKNSEKMGSKDLTVRNDPRVTKFGKFLRMFKINELPQLFNLLIGDMTLIGPRPLMPDGFNRYEEKYINSIYNIKPGITGLGSILFRDEELVITNSKLSPEDCYKTIILPCKGKMELLYQEKMSFYLDLKILFLTVFVILLPKSKIISTLTDDYFDEDCRINRLMNKS